MPTVVKQVVVDDLLDVKGHDLSTKISGGLILDTAAARTCGNCSVASIADQDIFFGVIRSIRKGFR